ncbi:adenylate cyclase [Alkalilimnicola ehrlichii]|uniref:Adenylate cyclase n=1 Tax=Alkalilimnicola ehrlichii TaxID=351052 RepID=A0A3E0WLH9_9GAMM|nr:CYTH domain-containing protein [Alkalilimnicola ehrlichii]RFA24676.1 adenylate cyclase [Alkalilimnicola ehrlichii]RFA33814.1 adenylate cyclase [Alkalilimnicola ehrlichii]
MAEEIERKFLLKNDTWRSLARSSARYRQGYLASRREVVVRVRLSDDTAFLTIKGEANGIRRLEYEYPLPIVDAEEMLDLLCERPLIEKERFFVPYGDHLWEVDVFAGDNAGLVLAEVELQDPDEVFVRPPWVGEEVSEDPRFYNANLVKYPFKSWSTDG